MIPWQTYSERYPMLISALAHAKRNDRMAHAYLLATSNPDYRAEFPLLLAALRVCAQPKQDGGPCLECSECRQLLGGIYPDFHVLSPTSKAREIVIGKDSDDPDTLRWFEARFHLSSVSASGWKIGVIQEADTMNESAQNAFLKTLEEPPGKCLFLLTTGRISALLPTIRSRCQILSLTDNRCEYKFPRCSDVPAILENLVLQETRSLMRAEDCTRALLEIASSLMAAAQNSAQERWSARLEAAKELENAGVKLIEKRIDGEAGSEYRRNREQFISMIHAWFAQIALLTEDVTPAMMPNPEILPDPGKVRKLFTPERARRMLDAAENLMAALNTNVNDELALRTFCLSINLMLRKVPQK
ncbi:MAG: DNA polymerase III subunit [Lentisphaeria bacterium]|nr:DNA polymerase III subunit [Lentisphaeria bacterium]